MIRRRFGRRRRGGDGGGQSALDAERWLPRLSEAGVLPAGELENAAVSDVPGSFAVTGRGGAGADAFVFGFSPTSAADALLATLALATESGETPFTGEAFALAPDWTSLARQRISLLGELSFNLRCLAVPGLSDEGGDVSAEPLARPNVVPVTQVAAQLASPALRALFARTAEGLEGLAAKHGGAVRGTADTVELVLLAKRVAVLRAQDGSVMLDTLMPRRTSEPVDAAGLAAALDRLEGNLRKRLNDGRVRSGEEGIRSRLLAGLADSLDLRTFSPWPIGGADVEVVDLVGVDGEGRPIVAAIRESFSIANLGPLLDATIAAHASLPVILAGAGAPLRFERPRLVAAAERFDASVLRILERLAIDVARVDLSDVKGDAPALAVTDQPATSSDRDRSGPSRRSRRGRRPRRNGAPTNEAPEASEEVESEPAGAPRFDEMSSFDLEEGSGDSATRGRGRGRGRRRGRGRGRGGEDRPTEASGASDEPGEEEASEEGPSSGRGRRRGRGRRPEPERAPRDPEASTDDVPELPDTLAPLAPIDLSEPELPEIESFDDEEDEESEGDRWRREREERRQRAPAASLEPPEPVPPPPPKPRRAAIVAHADRDAVVAAVLLAREVRLLEGIWVYPQEELMTFFRGVATDLRDEAPIFLVGFTASPARDIIQAASLYRGRLHWFDHHDWPPEDLERMRAEIGEDALHVEPGVGSSLPLIQSEGTRRSRFSDKVVDLLTGRFSEHDFRRWGRWWWWRLGEIASQSGDRRADLDPLLTGRPSELAKAVENMATPPEPEEVGYVSSRDFRVVHFGGYTLVTVPIPANLDRAMTARVARERYAAHLSLAWVEGEELVVLGGDESANRRSLDLSGMVAHVATKHDWVHALPGDDHVARLRVSDLAGHPERIDAVLAEIAMGRSILEG